MIRDISELDRGAELHADVGIVGAGFAGADLARYLGGHGVRVVLLESGRRDFDPQTQALARVESVGKPLRTPDPDSAFTPYLAPIFRGETRIRQFGGTSNIWTGKWRMFDALTFEARAWVPHSGWPIGLDDLLPFYAQVAADYGLGDIDTFTGLPERHELRVPCAAAGLSASVLYWEHEPLRVGDRFGSELHAASCVDVVLGANVTEIVLDETLGRVDRIVFKSLGGSAGTLSADSFVLATGGLEVARLLLASNRQVAGGVGNDHDLVGRFFMDHPKHKLATLQPTRRTRSLAARLATNPKPRFQLVFSLSPETQRQASLLNHAVSLSPVYRYTLDYPTAQTEGIKAALRTRDAGRLTRSVLGIVASPRAVWKVLQRLVYRDRAGPVAHYATTMYVEQAPNPHSRLSLGTATDALGVPELVVDWRLSPLDHESFERLLRELPVGFARATLGWLDFGPAPVTLDDTVDAAHHIGATRMAATRADGVVDADCKVFGVENLFIASCSVFPTGDSATPTYTLVALARRLGAHLLRLRAGGDGSNRVTG